MASLRVRESMRTLLPALENPLAGIRAVALKEIFLDRKAGESVHLGKEWVKPGDVVVEHLKRESSRMALNAACDAAVSVRHKPSSSDEPRVTWFVKGLVGNEQLTNPEKVRFLERLIRKADGNVELLSAFGQYFEEVAQILKENSPGPNRPKDFAPSGTEILVEILLDPDLDAKLLERFDPGKIELIKQRALTVVFRLAKLKVHAAAKAVPLLAKANLIPEATFTLVRDLAFAVRSSPTKSFEKPSGTEGRNETETSRYRKFAEGQLGGKGKFRK